MIRLIKAVLQELNIFKTHLKYSEIYHVDGLVYFWVCSFVIESEVFLHPSPYAFYSTFTLLLQ